jgi:hypothetical protein
LPLGLLEAYDMARVEINDDELRKLLEEAQSVGYLRREWGEAMERAAEHGHHPYYEDKALAEKEYYEQAYRDLYENAGITPNKEDE